MFMLSLYQKTYYCAFTIFNDEFYDTPNDILGKNHFTKNSFYGRVMKDNALLKDAIIFISHCMYYIDR